jgi:phage host-nuclease inhibitor protein Gam
MIEMEIMKMETIEQKLDRLAEFEAQKTIIEMDKKRLMDEIKVPDEILQLQNESNRQTQAFESSMHNRTDTKRKEVYAKLEAIQVPAEVRAIFDEIARQRAEVEKELEQAAEESKRMAMDYRSKLFAETQAKTERVYKDLATRKAEIEAEFAGRTDALSANIEALRNEIKDDVIDDASIKLSKDLEADDLSVKGKFYHAVYSRGRITWEKKIDRLPRKFADVIAEIDSFVVMADELSTLRKMVSDIASIFMSARKEGDPSVAIKKI